MDVHTDKIISYFHMYVILYNDNAAMRYTLPEGESATQSAKQEVNSHNSAVLRTYVL